MKSSTSDLMPKGDLKGASSRPSGLRHFIIISLFVVGLVVCVTSLLSILFLPSFVTNQISKRLVLKNNSLLLERWSKPNVPMYFKVWVFDVQNAQQVIDKRGTKPQLKEVGPFVFHLKRQKDIVSFAGDNLYYTERKIYHFAPELSCCAINMTVTIPNIPLVAVVDRALSYNLPLVGRFIPRLINRAIQSLREQLFVKKQVREILFDGYEVDLLKMVSRVGSLVGLPQTNQKFALLKGRNDTWRPEQDGVWAINTGARDRRMFGRVSSWNSYKSLPFWAAPGCNTINGSDGTLFPPPIKKSEPLYIFNQELCRTVNLVYDRPSDIRAIRALRFVLNPLNFAHTMSGTRRPNVGTFSSASPTNPSQQHDGGVANPLGSMLAPVGPAQPQVTPLKLIQDLQRQQQQSNLRRISQNQDLGTATSDNSGGQVSVPPNSSELNNINVQGRWKNNQKPASAPVPEAQQAARMVQAAQDAHLSSRSQSRANPFSCFCDRKSTNLNGANVCEFDGLIDLSKCTKQAQVIFGSMPHFYQADPRLPRQVLGLEPNASKHTTYLDIEPNTGLVLGGKRRVQLNLIIKRNNEVDGFENINDMLVPVVWFEESALIPEESARKFKLLYTDRIRLVNIVLTTLFLAAIGLLAIDMKLLVSHYSHCFDFKMNCKISSSSNEPVNHLKSASNNSSSSTTANNNSNGSQAPLTGKKQRRSNLRANLSKPIPVKAVAAAMLGRSNDTQATKTHHQSLNKQEEADYLGRTRRSSNGQLNLPLLSNANGSSNSNSNNANDSNSPHIDFPADSMDKSAAENKSVELVVHYNDTLLIDANNHLASHSQTINYDTVNNNNNTLANKSIIEIDTTGQDKSSTRPNTQRL